MRGPPRHYLITIVLSLGALINSPEAAKPLSAYSSPPGCRYTSPWRRWGDEPWYKYKAFPRRKKILSWGSAYTIS